MRITPVNDDHSELTKKPADASRRAFSFFGIKHMTMKTKLIQNIFIFVVLICAVCPVARAQEDAVRARYNAAIENIIKDIIKSKSGYPELESFSASAIREDSRGYKSSAYSHDASGGAADPYNYRFSVGIKSLDSQPVSDSDSWEHRFPLLGFKVVIEAKKLGEWTSFDASRIVETNLEDLKVVEQDFLPFRLDLKTDKEVYSVREEIVLTATLKNVTIQPYKLADLDESSLYCKIGEKEWGGEGGGVLELSKVLSAYGTVKKILKVSGMETPQELWIGCSYALGYKGVQPYSRIKISVQPKR